MDIPNELNKIYFNHENWHSSKLSEQAAYDYHRKLLEQGNILTVSDGEVFCGYVEFWRITYLQFGLIICGEQFSALDQDVLHGNIAYVANTFIYPEYRKGTVYKMLRNKFFEVNKHCTHFVGEARRKKSAPIKVFKREEILERV